MTRDTENLTKICNCCPLPCEHHLAICCVLSEISHSNKLVSRGHLANHGFIETAVKSRWIFVAVIKTIGRKSSYITAMFPIMRIMYIYTLRIEGYKINSYGARKQEYTIMYIPAFFYDLLTLEFINTYLNHHHHMNHSHIL